MLRVASLTLVIGAVLLLSWVISPAAPRPQQPSPASSAPGAEWANLATRPAPRANFQSDIDQLRERLVPAPAFRAPARDPFQFAARATPLRTPADAPAAVVAPAAAPAPRLIAILSKVIDGALVHTAAFASGDAVRVVVVGDTVDALTVRAITADAVELANPVTGVVTRLTLR